MSSAAESQKPASSKAGKLGGKEFEETFKPKKRDASSDIDADDDKNNKSKKKKDKKKKSVLSKVIIIVMVLIVLIGGAGAALYFSGNLNRVFELVGLAEPPPGMTIEQQQAALDQREASLNEKEKSLADQQTELDARQKALEDAESAASASAASVANYTFEELLASLSEEKLAELKQVGAIYSKMDATAAAAIITKIYDDKQIAVIIYNMQPAASALVLAKLEAGLAARVTQILAS